MTELAKPLKEAIDEAKRIRGCRVEDICRELGINRQSLYVALKTPRSLSLTNVRIVADMAKLDEEARFEMERAWLLDRFEAGQFSSVFAVLMRHADKGTKAQRRQLIRELLEVVESKSIAAQRGKKRASV